MSVYLLPVLINVYFSSQIYGLLYDPRECRTSRKGAEYMGTVNVTSSGLECQRWDSQEPHQHTFTNPLMFPDRDFDSAANHCRNPDKDNVPWCYTTNPDIRYQFCDIPYCDVYPSCNINKADRHFKSDRSTVAGKMKWKKDSGEESSYSIPDLIALGNLHGENCANDPEGCKYIERSDCKPSATCTTTKQGTDYVGRRSLTVTGKPCQRWDRQFPHSHNFMDDDLYPDGNITEAENFCRNPDHSQGLWCYTTDPGVKWEYCDIPVCSGCKQTTDGRGYAGTEASTQSGLACQTWLSHGYNDAEQFPDPSVENAYNYCRNPDGKPCGPWCYFAEDDAYWDYCDIPLCTEQCVQDSMERRNIKHVVHFGIDGLHATCWQNASGGVPNFLRMASEGSHTYSKARAEIRTWSAPNWSAHLCGMGTEETGVTDNSWLTPWMGNLQAITPVSGINYPMPCAFHYLKGMDANIRTAAFPNWDWFYEMTGRGFPGALDVDYFCEPDYPAGLSCDWELVGNASEYIKSIIQSAERSYTFISIDEVDSKGHAFGWCTPPYLNAVNEADAMLGLLMDAVEGEDVLLIVSTDHGGGLDGHGNYRDRDLLIPMWIKGPGVKVNYEMQGQVRNRDILPTLAWAMGFKGSPFWRGDVIYEIFE